MNKNRGYQKNQGDRIIKCICGICLCLLLAVLPGAGMAYAQEISWPVEGQDHIYADGSLQPRAGTEKNRAKARSSEGTLNLYRNGVASYYGAQLDTSNEQAVYAQLVTADQQKRIKSAQTQSTSIEVKLENKVELPATEGTNSAAYRKLYNEIGKAIDAFLFDYNENYWIFGYRWIPQSSNNSITKIKIWFTDYYDGIRSELNMTDSALQKLEKKVTGNSRYEIVKKAYEEVIKLVVYPSDDQMAYHTITGGLLDKYHHRGVCDCYARLFKLLCQKNGIACIMVPGGSDMINGEVQMDHIWNYVQMEDGKWYLVDCTWDDQGTDKPRGLYFLAGSASVGLDSLLVGRSHMAVGRFTNSDYTPFSVPALSVTAYQAERSTAKVPQSALMNKNGLVMKAGTTEKLTALLTPADASTDQLKWSSTNTAVLSVAEVGGTAQAYITAKSAGTATIRVSWGNTVLAETTVKVYGTQGSTSYKIKLNVSSLPIQVKKTTSALKVTSIYPDDSVKQWKSSNSKVVKVDKRTGKLTALKKGTAVITVTSRKGAKASCKIKVQTGKVATKKLTLKKTSVELNKGKSYSVKVTRSPLTANDKLTYKTSNKKVATVSAGGKITARKKGTATITVRSASGKKARLKVKVR